jgi:hypothetical protein
VHIKIYNFYAYKKPGYKILNFLKRFYVGKKMLLWGLVGLEDTKYTFKNPV